MAAAPAPLPAVAAPGGALPEQDAQFDQALSASLSGKQPQAVGEPRGRLFTETPALFDWLLLGMPSEATLTEPDIDADTETVSGDGSATKDDVQLVEAADCRMPDVVFDIVATPQPQTPPVAVDDPGDQPLTAADLGLAIGSSALNAPVRAQALPGREPQPTSAAVPVRDASDAIAAEPQSDVLPGAPVIMRQVAAKDPAPAARRIDGTMTTHAADVTPHPTEPATMAETIGQQAMAEIIDQRAMAEIIDQRATADSEQPAVVSHRPMPGRPIADVTPQPQAGIDAALQDAASAVATTPAPAPARASGREDTAPAVRNTLFGADAMPRAPEMSGGDAQNSEQESRQSPAAQRLAAALSSIGSPAAESAGSAPAPVFTVTGAPSAPVAAVHTVAPTAPASALQHPDVENVHRLVETMRITAKAGGWEATVRLRPEHLGEVTIALRVDGNTVSAVVQAESASVRQWLQSQEEAVRSGLSEHGLDLGRYQVDRDGQRRDAEDPQQQQQPRRRSTPRRSADADQRFEVVV
jgi:flagellar hook-length control protein FliK